MGETIRLNKYLAACGICSRREADRLIEQGRVQVNGKTAAMGQAVETTDKVTVNGKSLQKPQEKKVYAFYKPVGVVCTEKDRHAEKVINDIVKCPVRVTYAGRLDKESEGLLLLTNDGALVDAMMRGSNHHEKEYLVRVEKEITDVFLSRMAEGIYLEELDVTTRPCKVERVGKCTFLITLTQGLNRQVRRMCRACGYHVRFLKRVRVMGIQLGDLKSGEYREIKGKELENLYLDCGMNIKA